uniref:Uncharacterized protein n=1 Tax=Strigamia maritima TaxID=126957 RepID=T1J0W0_STRMM
MDMDICGVHSCVDNDPSAASTPKSTDESNDSSITLFNRLANRDEASPWLSKPRRDSEFHLSLTEAEASDVCTPKRNMSFQVDRNTKTQYIKLRKADCCFLFTDCVKILSQILGIEVDLKGVALDEVKCSLQYELDAKQTALQLRILKNENKELRYQIQLLKQLLKEERNASCETEKEVYSSRKNIQMLLNDRRKLQAELIEVNKGKLNTKSTESQTDESHNLNNLKKLDITCRLYQLSTEKLLKFTKVVHEVLTEYKSSLSLSVGDKKEKGKSEKKSMRQPAKIKRAASIQNITGDISKFFVSKHADRVCRAASVCTVRTNIQSSESEKFDVIDRLANKAKEISSTIENILFESAGSNPRLERVEWV